MSESEPFALLFVQAIREAFGIELSAETVNQLRRAVGRVRSDSAADLVSAIVLACYETRAEAGTPLTDDDVRRAIWRVVKATTREAERRASLDLARVSLLPPTPAPEVIAARADEYHRILQAAGELSDRDWLIVGMWAEGRTSEEIGEKAGLNADAVRQIVSRSLKQLRRTIESERPSSARK